MNSYGIRKRLLIIILLVALIPLVIMGFFGYLNTKNIINDREEEKLQNFFSNIEGKLIKFFYNSEKDVNFLKEITKQELTLTNDELIYDTRKEIENVYYHFSKNNIQYDQIKFIDKDGYEQVRINNLEGEPYIVSRDELQYKGNRYYVKESKNLKEGQIYVSNLDLNRENGKIEIPYKPVIRYVTPIYIEDKLMGFVVLNLNANYILKDIEKVQNENKYNNLMLINKEGKYILHPQKSKEWGSEEDLNTGENFKNDYLDIYEEILATDQMEIRHIKSNILAWDIVKLDSIKDGGLILFVEIQEDKYLQPLKAFRTLFIIVLIITGLIVSITSGIIVKYFTNPIIKLAKAVSNIGKGNFDVDLTIETNDELQTLSKEIENMSQDLKSMYVNMEELVYEKTKELQKAKDKLEEFANRDSLTGLYNRHYFNEYISIIADQGIEENKQLIFLMIDIDKFKYINDTYGHNIGDIVLKDVASILKKSSRDSDIVVRYGGDEFLVVLYGEHSELVHKYIDRVREKIKLYNENNDILKHELTLSIGFDEYKGKRDILEVINSADKMMYENKMAKRKKE